MINRERKREGAPLPNDTLRPHVTTVQLDDALADGQSKTTCARCAADFRGLLEFLEDLRQLVGRDARAGVAYLEKQVVAVLAEFDMQADIALFRQPRQTLPRVPQRSGSEDAEQEEITQLQVTQQVNHSCKKQGLSQQKYDSSAKIVLTISLVDEPGSHPHQGKPWSGVMDRLETTCPTQSHAEINVRRDVVRKEFSRK